MAAMRVSLAAPPPSRNREVQLGIPGNPAALKPRTPCSLAATPPCSSAALRLAVAQPASVQTRNLAILHRMQGTPDPSPPNRPFLLHTVCLQTQPNANHVHSCVLNTKTALCVGACVAHTHTHTHTRPPDVSQLVYCCLPRGCLLLVCLFACAANCACLTYCCFAVCAAKRVIALVL